MYDPAAEGFSARLCAIDRCQIGMLRAIAGQYGSRLYLKGGMAMRALFGSLRLTKDIDFERDPSLSNASLVKALPKALQSAALNAGLHAPAVAITKETKTTIRASLGATLKDTGEPVHYEVEISGRGLPPAEHLVRLSVVPPIAYRITQFGVNSFDAHAMAATKVAALHSGNRSVPRDIFDLADLIAQNADPVPLLRRADRKWIKAVSGHTLARAGAIDWNRADAELVLPRSVRESLDALAWEDMCLHVAETVDSWLRDAQ
jgi:predicted nucleotidyltransferase component of viral defense system